MRLSSRFASALAWATLAVSVVTIAVVRPAAADRYAALAAKNDVYALPSPEQTLVASLGYRAALADFIFAHVLVSQGLHHEQGRRYEFVGQYLDTINTLDPTFRDPYYFADTLIVVSAETPRVQEYVKAKEVFERGFKNRPYDAELWLVGGQYMKYLAVPWIEDPELKSEFRRRGEAAIARACDMASSDQRMPVNCLALVHSLQKEGKRDAAIRQLKRYLAVTDDPAAREEALKYLDTMLSELASAQAKRRGEAFRERWGNDITFVSRDVVLLLGPDFDPAVCAGPQNAEKPECVVTWRAWGQQFDVAAEAD